MGFKTVERVSETLVIVERLTTITSLLRRVGLFSSLMPAVKSILIGRLLTVPLGLSRINSTELVFARRRSKPPALSRA